MKTFYTLTLLAFITGIQATSAQFQFISPVPGSKNLTIEHTIILREGSNLDPSSLNKNLFAIRGSKSGAHDFNVVLCDDGKTINLNPITPFGFDEDVAVTILRGLVTADRRIIDGYSFSFKTHREWTAEEKENMTNIKSVLLADEIKKWGSSNGESDGDDTRGITGMFTINNNTAPSPGDVFFDVWSGNFVSNSFTGYSEVTSAGDSVYWKKLISGPNDFQLGKNGYLETFRTETGRFDVIDSNLALVDHYVAANGYGTNNHELQMEANGNAWLIGDEFQTIDMTVYNPNYNPNATVLGNVIQEFDASHNLLFEWRGFDHVEITEATHENLAFSFIDYMHTNAIEQDVDGNILISSRHLDQIDKINVSTGNFIWRLGGLNNEFSFIGDQDKFSYQHDIRRLANGNITLFDDGNFHVPARSFAKEYQLDEVAKTATLVWSYGHPKVNGQTAFYFAMGNAQRLPNGNTFIGWGWRASGVLPSYTEVTAAGAIVWELKLKDNGLNLVSYRAHRYQWNPCGVVNPTYVTVSSITSSSAKVDWEAVKNATSYDVQYRKLGNAGWNMKNTTSTVKKLKNLKPDKSYEYQVRTHCANGYTSDWTATDTFTTLPQKLLSENSTTIISFQLSPNPVQDELNISYETSGDQSAVISVYDIAGRILFTARQQFTKGENAVQIDVSDLTPGFYFAEVRSDVTQKVLKFVKE